MQLEGQSALRDVELHYNLSVAPASKVLNTSSQHPKRTIYSI